ncbi:MAG: sodium:calcium antiporter [Deltaproteobacteria bacterium]|nr:sodium:calcium antiporter [Deltaproteobacteria bacterium]
MALSVLIFIASLVMLLLSAKYFTGAAEKLGFFFGLSPFTIGVFIVGIGTSLPELVSGILAGASGNSEIVSGNVLGANTSNIFLIIGVIALLSSKGIELGSQYIMVDLHFMIGSAFLLGLIMMDGKIAFAEGIFLLSAYGIYAFFLLKSGEKAKIKLNEKQRPIPVIFPLKELLVALVTSLGIYIGANYTVQSIVDIAHVLRVPPSLISLTVLSFGTTLPELTVSTTAIKQGKQEIAVGNILGSCVFNALVIPGAVSAFGDIHVPEYLIHFFLPLFVVASVFFYLLTQDKKISKWEGLLFLVFYGFFISRAIAVFV